jgi:hypothetical protein
MTTILDCFDGEISSSYLVLYIYGGCIGSSIWMVSSLGCGMTAMDTLYLVWGFSILFLYSWVSFSYSTLSLGVCYRAGMCMDLSVDFPHYVEAYYLVLVCWYLPMCVCGGRSPSTVLHCCSLRVSCRSILFA